MRKIVFLTFQASRVNVQGRSSGLQRILFIFPRRAKRRFSLKLTVTWSSWGNQLCAIAQGSLETFTEQLCSMAIQTQNQFNYPSIQSTAW